MSDSSTREAFGPGEREEGVWKGVIAEDADSPNAAIGVTVPGYDPDQVFGPCTFTPRPAWGGGRPLLPGSGDPCIVGFDDGGNANILTWWVEEVITTAAVTP